MILKRYYLYFATAILYCRQISAQCGSGIRDIASNCVVFENLHIKTFDGTVLSYNSKCPYTLTSINSNGINLEVNLLQNPPGLQVKYGEHTFEIRGVDTASTTELIRDGKVQSIPHVSYGVSISKPGSMIVVEIKEIGMKIRFDGKTTELIQNNQNNNLKMSGMCGNNDGCTGNDLVMKNGQATTSSVQFGNSWAIGGCTAPTFVNSCGSNRRLVGQAQNFCNSLFSNQKFTKCGEFSSQFMNICTSNYCNCKLANRNDCMCDMLDAFVRTCQLKNNELISWRSSSLCPIDCRILDQQYMTCAPGKRQLSCGEEEIDPSKYDCEEGCYCPAGLRLFQDRCLFVDECPCTYNDNVYNPGTSIAQECNTCICKKGKWDCTNKICTIDGNCIADPHYTTFDNKKYDFMGKCIYYLVRGIGFDVMCDHYIWNGAFVKDVKSPAPSYCAKVIVQIRDDVVELEQNHNVKINGHKLDWLPYTAPGFTIAQPSNLWTTVSLKNFVTVSWNGVSGAYVSIPTTMIGRVKGLLGTYTKNPDDDFLMPNGTITTNPNEFGNSWKVPGSCENEYNEPVIHPCSLNPGKRAKAERMCALLKSNLFEGCLDEDSNVDYENCIYDGCQCPDEQTTCVCDFYALQAKKCAAKGIYVNWRQKVTECAVKCPEGQTFQLCGNSCTRSCEDIATNPTCEQKCVEGCNCPEGQTLNNKKQCVPINKCTCIWEEGRYNPDFTFIDGDNKCTCTNAKWNITTATTDDKDKYPSLNELKEKCSADNFLTYTGCKRTNTLTCQNKHLNEQPDYNNCQSGCQCMEGFVLDTEYNSCIRPEDCPCMYNGISYLNKTERIERDKKCVCEDGFWSCTPSTDHWEKCSVWSNIHVRTFDETIYSFKGNCEYTLFEHTFTTTGVFSVTLNTAECNVGSCIANVNIYHRDANGREDRIIFRNGQEFESPAQLANLVITDLDLSIMVDVVGLGVRVVWNKSGWVHIHVSRVWISWNHVGLCGKYDDNPGNDLETPNKENSVTQLVNYYRVNKTCAGSTELEKVNLLLTENSCEILYSEVFKTCRYLKPVEEYYNRCLIDINLQLLIPQNERFNYYCQTLSAYAQECNDVNQPVVWRTNNICPYQCKANKHYYPCETPCPKETCQNTDGFSNLCRDKVCSEACNVKKCPANTVYEDSTYGECIAKEECGGLSPLCENPYQNIQTCTVEGNCVGDPHCTTFDGKRYDFMGKCTYYLVRGNGFDVMCDHYVWNGAFVKDVKSTAPSYCARVIVQIQDDIIELEQKHMVRVNGQIVHWFPYIAPGIRISQPSSELTTVALKNFVSVSWNGHSRAAVRIPITMKGRVKGLLGTYTKTQNDDFLMPNETITTDPNAFGNSWKVPGSCEDEYTGPVPHPCSINPSKRPKAEQACALLKSDLFQGCLEDVEAEYENCIYDACQCPDEQTNCVCEFYAIQGKRCAAKGKYVDWRKNITECAVKCPAGQTYQVCGNSCTRSCEDISANPTCVRDCVEGCNCPQGLTLDNKNRCVPINTCPCTWEGERYPPNFVFINTNNKYTCANGNWDITIATVDDKDKYPSLNELKMKCNADNFLVYAGCMRTNTLTCKNKHLNEQADYSNCQSGCQCMEGFVFDTELKRCVRPDDCPCMYKGVSYPDKTERNERNQKCICNNGLWSCTPSTDHWEKCSIWGNVHIRTFDELIYSFAGNCEYTLFEHTFATNGLFRVTLKTVKCNIGSCIANINIYHRDTNGKEDSVTFTKGQDFVPPGQLANLVITDLDLSIMVDVVGLGVRVVWNKGGWVHIHVSRVWTTWNHVGLCGKYDDNPANDLQIPTKENGVTKLVDYYRVDKTCPASVELEKVNILLIDSSCDILYTEVFKTCRLLKSVEEYYNRCLIEANLQLLIPQNERSNYYCQTLSVYAQECNDVNTPVQWRTNNICPYQCKANKVYYSCETPCPKETCQNTVGFPTLCPDKVCSEACNVRMCPADTIYRDSTYGECIPKEECGGTSATCKDPNQNPQACTVEANCVADPHCTTFDGKRYDFMGKCTYYMVRGNGFDVMCDHYIWNGAFIKDVKSTLPSYCAKVIVQVNDDIIELEQRHSVRVNGQKLDWFPYITSEFRISQPSSELTTVVLKNFVTVSWNGNSRAAVRIPITMKGRVNGLLGTYTKTQDDDFLMPNGTITTNPTVFGNSWKVPGSCEDEHTGPVPHPCDVNPNKIPKAKQACALLKSDLFEGCVEDVDGDYENCLYDACQCPDEQTKCLCEFYAIQGDRCSAKGKYVDWRKNITECAIKCPAGQTYQMCGNSCTRSCEDISTSPTCKRKCVEGCNCPEGLTLNNRKQCVPINTCPCTWERERYPPNFIFIDGDLKYTCKNGKWDTTKVTVEDKDKYPSLNDLKKKCDANKFLVYSGCKRINTITCQNKHLNQQPDYENCQNGCQCMEGFVLDTELDKCVRPNDCPCIHKGISYPSKYERLEKGQKCVCQGGFWSCTPTTDYWEKCSVWGHVHIRTFDELVYSFKGNCEYTLFEHTFGTNGLFRVTLNTVKCNVGSCIANVNIYHKDANGKEDRVTFTKGQDFVPPGQLTNLIITDLDLSIMVDVVGLGVRVVWNKSGWVHIHLSRVWTTWNHNGLCGKYDDNPHNDLQTPNNENSVTQLVDYHRVDKTCPGSSELKKVNLILIENSCDILYSEVFKTCRFLKSTEEYYNRCLIEANLQLLIPQNERFNYYCETLSAYAQECNDVNVPVQWRTNEICPYQCKPNKVYYSCETPCSKETCQNTNGFATLCQDKVCSEACNVKTCPTQTVYKDSTYGECIPKQQCAGGTALCNQSCTCHTTNDESSSQSINFGCDSDNKSCSPVQFIFNIYFKGTSKK